jgi:uncharacterized protein
MPRNCGCVCAATGMGGIRQGDAMSMIQDICTSIRTYPGLTRKRTIHLLTDTLAGVCDFGFTAAAFGEDAAAIRYGDQYLLLAADGIWPGLIRENPYGAGKASVMASVNDIYAMGGRPLAMVNVLGISEDRFYSEIVRGITKACLKYRVPMAGGHLHPDAHEVSLSVAIMGVARKLLLSTNAREHQDIVFAVDLEGRGYQCRPVLSWDTNSGKDSQAVLERLEVLPEIAEQGLCATCKDVSNAGVLGTVALLLEASKAGAVIDIERIPKPESFTLIDWLKAFLSYGFIMSVDRNTTDSVIEAFTRRQIAACRIGTITAERKLIIGYKREKAVLFDFEHESITGLVA